MAADTELPKIKQLNLSDMQMDYVAACVLQSTCSLYGELGRALVSGLHVHLVADKLGPDSIAEIITQLDKIVTI